MIAKLTAAMADKTLNETLKHYAKWDVLIVDEFGFDRPSALPSPISSEPTTVPADDRLRFHDDEDTLPVSPDSAQQQALLHRSG